MAETKSWNVTEESASGIKSAQGTWSVSTEGDKITGRAEMQAADGEVLTYKLEGSVKDGAYTIKFLDRTDGKKDCVWSGHTPSAGGTQSHGLIGEAPCAGTKLLVRAGF